MSKVTLARSLADEFGTTFNRAKRFVDDVGESRARTVLGTSGQPQGRRALPQTGVVRAGDDAGRTLPSNKALGVGAAATGIGGGALLWRREGRLEEQAEAQAAEQYDQSLQEILGSDLPPEVMEDLASSAAAATGNNPTNGGNGLLDAIPGVPSLGINEGLQTILTIVVVLGIIYYLSDDSANINIPTTGGGGD